MASSVSLRRSLRQIPEIRSLPGTDLDTIIKGMEYKQYTSGDVLWRAGNKIDFLAIIQSGEIVTEYRVNHLKIHAARLAAGDYLKPRDLNGIDTQSSVLVRANTDVVLYVLPAKQLVRVQSKLYSSKSAPSSGRSHRGLLRGFFFLLIATLILVMNRADAIRILTGGLSLRAYQENASIHNDQDFFRMLNYIQVVDPNAIFAQNEMGLIWYQSNDLQRSKLAYRRALEIDQGNSAALNNLAVIDFLNGQTLQAVLAQQKAVQQEPNHARIRYNLGLILAGQNRYREAIRELKEASYMEPDWSLPYIQRGSLYIRLQDYPHAEEEARVAIKLDPMQHAAHLILAIAQYNQGDEPDALQSIERAVQIAPEDPVTLFYKSLILQRMGRSEAALQILNHLHDLTADPEEITRLQTEIDAIHFYLGTDSLRIERKDK